jgi:DNA polymerase III subunit delta
MQLAAAQLPTHLQRGIKSLYTLHGDEPLLIQEAADAIRAHARTQGYTERTVHTVAGAHFDWSEVLASGGSLSLFADKQIVEVRVPSGKPGKEGSPAIQHLAQAAQDNDSTLTLFILPKLDKMTKTGAWFGALESFGITLQIDSIERRVLPQWIAQRLGALQLRVKAGEEGERTLKFFADRVEGNLLAAHQEMQKLALLYPAGSNDSASVRELGFDEVEAAVLNVARYDVFKLSEAVLAGNQERVQRMLDGLQAEGEATVLVHWTLGEDIRNLHRLRGLMDDGRPLPVALQEARVWGMKQKLFERILPRLSSVDAANLLHAAHQVDGIVKGLKQPGWPTDPWLALHQLAMMVCKVVV